MIHVSKKYELGDGGRVFTKERSKYKVVKRFIYKLISTLYIYNVNF